MLHIWILFLQVKPSEVARLLGEKGNGNIRYHNVDGSDESSHAMLVASVRRIYELYRKREKVCLWSKFYCLVPTTAKCKYNSQCLHGLVVAVALTSVHSIWSLRFVNDFAFVARKNQQFVSCQPTHPGDCALLISQLCWCVVDGEKARIGKSASRMLTVIGLPGD